MFKALQRWWRYLAAKVGMRLDESADPKVQLEQAIREARQQHKRLMEQATNVIANQKQTQLRLDRAIEDYEKSNASARQALLLADQEARDGNQEKASSFNAAAEAFANKIIGLETQVAQLKQQLQDAGQASERAKAAVAQNSAALQKKFAEREQLLSQLDQAKMQEEMNTAMSQLSETVGEDVPTFEEVRTKIERRVARAQAASEIGGTSVDTKMLEVEQAQMSAEAQARLSELRSELGLSSPPATPAAERQTGSEQPEGSGA
jgi:phage shock protein A